MRFTDDDDQRTEAEPTTMKMGLIALLLILGVILVGSVPAGFWMLRQQRLEAMRAAEQEAIAAERLAREHAARAAEKAARPARVAEERARQAPQD